MKLTDWLRKLGILRYGTCKAVYTSGKDMPAPFLMDGVYDAEKDLTHASDFKRTTPGTTSAACRACGTAVGADDKFCTQCGAAIPAGRKT